MYLTTGKVLIQGNGHEEFCDNEFPKCLGLVNKYTNIHLPNTANNDIVHSDNHDNSDQTLIKSTIYSVQSDGLDLAQSDISDETLIKCLDDHHEFDPETSDQTDSVTTNTHKPVHVDNQAESYTNTHKPVHVDNQAESYTNTHKPVHVDNQAESYTNTHKPVHVDNQAESYTNTHKPVHVDNQAESYTNTHKPVHVDNQAESYTNTHKPVHVDNQAESYTNTHKPVHVDNQAESYTNTHKPVHVDNQAESYTNTHKPVHVDNQAESYTNTHKPVHVDNQAESYTNTHKPVHVDNQAESYTNTSECSKATSKQDFIESNKTDQAKVSDHSLKTHQVKVTQQIESALIDPLVRRLDILENSVVQISNIAANSMSLQTAVKHDIAKIFEKLSRHKSSR